MGLPDHLKQAHGMTVSSYQIGWDSEDYQKAGNAEMPSG